MCSEGEAACSEGKPVCSEGEVCVLMGKRVF